MAASAGEKSWVSRDIGNGTTLLKVHIPPTKLEFLEAKHIKDIFDRWSEREILDVCYIFKTQSAFIFLRYP